MKKFIWLFALPAVVLAACNKPEAPSPDEKNQDQEIPEVIEFESSYIVEAAGNTISLTGASSVEIPADATSWLTQQAGNGKIDIKVSANDSYLERSAVITVKTAGDKPHEVTITQGQNDGIVLAESMPVSCEGGVVDVDVRANIPFTAAITSGDEWITDIQTKAVEDLPVTTYQVTVAPNISTARTGEITFTSQDGKIVRKIAVQQESRIWMDVTIDGPANPRNTTPVFNKEGTLAYFVTRGARRLYQIDLENQKMGWTFDMSEGSKADNGGRICVNPVTGDVYAANQKKVFCISPEGTQKWALDAPGDAASTVPGCGFAVSNDGSVIFFPTKEKKFYAVKASDGSVLASFSVNNVNRFQLLVYGEDNLFIFQEGGPILFKHFTGSAFEDLGEMGIGVGLTDLASPALSQDQTLVVVSRGDGYISTLNVKERKDHLDWRPISSSSLAMSPFFTPNGRVCIPFQSDSYIWTFDPTKKIYEADWNNLKTELGNNAFNYMNLACGVDGRIYYYANSLHAVCRLDPATNVIETVADLGESIPEYQATFNFGGKYIVVGGGKNDASLKNRIVVVKMGEITRAKGWYGGGGDACMSHNGTLVWGE